MSDRRYSPEVIADAVRQVVNLGQPLAEVAARVGVPEETLARWIDNAGSHDQAATVASEPAATIATGGSPGRGNVAIGKEIGDYEIVAELGRGGMGVVYKAQHRTLQRTVALKMVLAGAYAGQEELDRFLVEARAVAQLQHPNIVQIFDIGEHDGLPYFSLEYMDGHSLADSLQERPRTPDEAARLGLTLAEALHYAHAEGIVHRDIKPANILLTGDGQPKIADFGLAKHLESDAGSTLTGTVMGSPGYMSPEQAAGRIAEIGPAADQYSLGALLYRLITGRPPFVAAKAMEAIRQVIDNVPVAPRQLAPAIPVDLETICLKTLEKDPARRYASCREFADDLQRFLAGEPIQARPVGRVEKIWRWCRRNPRVAVPSAAAAVLLLAVAGVSSWSYVTVSRQADVIEAERDFAQEQERIARAQTGLALTTLQDVIRNVDGELAADPGLVELRGSVMEHLAQSWDKLDASVRDDEQSEAVPTLMAVRMKLVQIFGDLGQADLALAEIEKLYETGRRRVEIKGGSDASRRNMASICLTYAGLLNKMQRDPEAKLAKLDEARAFAADIVANPRPDPGGEGPTRHVVQHVLATCEQRIAVHHLTAGDLDAAAPGFSRSGEIWVALLASLEGDEEFLARSDEARQTFRADVEDALARSRLASATVALKRGETDAALDAFARICEQRRQRSEADPSSLRARFDYAEFAGNYGFNCLKVGRLERAEEILTEYLEIMTEFATNERFRDNQTIQDKYSLALYRQATLLQKLDRVDESRRQFAASRDLRRAIAAADSTNLRARTMWMLAEARSGNWHQATALATAIEPPDGPSARQCLELARAWAQSARFAGDRGGEFRQRALDLIQAAVQQGYDDRFELTREPDLDPLRDQTRFAAVLRSLGDAATDD